MRVQVIDQLSLCVMEDAIPDCLVTEFRNTKHQRVLQHAMQWCLSFLQVRRRETP